MKVSISWLKELVDLKISTEELIRLLPLRTIGLKEVTPEYIELDMKGYNRADLLSLRGVAYEVAAVTNSDVKFGEEENFLWQARDLPLADVTVEDKKLAPVYCIAKIENLKVEHSPETWVNKLNSSGIRAVNNVADITNLIMVEYGQPMHAFNKDEVKGSVRVRVAKKGEKITTLDGKTRNLTQDDLLIADDNQPIGIAGVMGGKESEISDQTSSILLEAAIFDPKTLRKTAAGLNLISEAGKRFYHGLTKQRLFQALDAAIKMYESIGGKLTALTIVDSSEKNNPVTIDLTQNKITSLIGVEITSKQVEQYLTSLKFQLASHITRGLIAQGSGNVVWKVTPPYFRLDIGIEEDLIEEVARMYGYEKIPAQPLSTTNTPSALNKPIFGLIESLKEALSKAGLTEVQTYSYYSTAVISNVKCQMSNLIKIANPISSETEYLRTDLWPNLLEVTAKNIKNGIKDVAIFEVGKVYNLQKEGLPEEHYHLSIALSNGTDNPIQELYQIYHEALKHLEGEEMQLHLRGGLEGKEYFHPVRQTDLMAEIHPRIVNKFGINQRVAVLEIDFTKIL